MSPQESSSPSGSNAALLGRLEASIMAESALIDKESGRVYWEGGSSSTLSASLIPKVEELGLSHLKATILSGLLLLALVSFVAHWIRQHLDAAATSKPFTGEMVGGTNAPFYKTVPLFILQWTLLKTPKLDGSFVICVILLYLLEAHTCSTRRFLANAITSPDEVEVYIERLRNEAPIITWKVRCFHYEKSYWLTPTRTVQLIWQKLSSKLHDTGKVSNTTTTEEEKTTVDDPSHVVPKESDNVSGPFKRKVISHQATSTYTFGSFIDDTMAGVWKRQISASAKPAPFMKIMLSKILVLANPAARDNYFKQQSNFVTREGMRDKFAEYSTNIEVPGFKRRMLAIQPVDGAPSSKLFRLNTFWIFTVLGMSLPYRIWFARHCDQLRVTVVKETYAEVVPKSTFMSGWFTSKTPAAPAAPGTNSSVFRQQMQSLLLYAKETKDNLPVEANVSLPTLSNTTKATTQDKPPVKFSEASEMQSPNAIQDIPPVKFSEASEMQSPNATKADQSTTKEDEAVQKDVFQRAANTEALETQEVEQWNSNSTRAETHGFKQEQTALDTRKSSDQAERPFPMLDTSLQNNANSVASSTNNISKEGKRGPNES